MAEEDDAEQGREVAHPEDVADQPVVSGTVPSHRKPSAEAKNVDRHLALRRRQEMAMTMARST
jgi:hypothetical protein